MSYFIRDMRLEDFEEVYAIEVATFSAPFSKDIFLQELTLPFARLKVLIEKGSKPAILGYIDYWFVADEVHLLNIAVAPDQYRNGLGSHLMEAMISEAKKINQKSIYLEVRISNKVGQAFYNKFSFQTVGTRKGYYVDNKEDALVMEMTLQ